MNSEIEKRTVFHFLLVLIYMRAFACVCRIEFYTVKAVLDYIGPNIRHHLSLRVKTCHVICMTNREFST